MQVEQSRLSEAIAAIQACGGGGGEPAECWAVSSVDVSRRVTLQPVILQESTDRMRRLQTEQCVDTVDPWTQCRRHFNLDNPTRFSLRRGLNRRRNFAGRSGPDQGLERRTQHCADCSGYSSMVAKPGCARGLGHTVWPPKMPRPVHRFQPAAEHAAHAKKNTDSCAAAFG